jgi:hypothetical protein
MGDLGRDGGLGAAAAMGEREGAPLWVRERGRGRGADVGAAVGFGREEREEPEIPKALTLEAAGAPSCSLPSLLALYSSLPPSISLLSFSSPC